MNPYFNDIAYPPPDSLFPVPHKLFRKLGDMTDPSPSGIWVVIDEREESINNGHLMNCMDGIFPRNPRQFGWINWPANYHNRASGLNFADGHSEIHKWLDPRTTPPQGKAVAGDLFAPIRTENN